VRKRPDIERRMPTLANCGECEGLDKLYADGLCGDCHRKSLVLANYYKKKNAMAQAAFYPAENHE